MPHAVRISLLMVPFWYVLASGQTANVRRLDGSTITSVEIETTVNRLIDAAKVTEIGISILNNRRVVYRRAFGARDVANNLPLTPDSVMTAASYSKSTFAVMVIMSNSSNAEGIFKELSETLIRNTYTPFEWEGYVPYTERPALPPPPERREIMVDPALLDSYVGRYQSEGQPAWTVARDGNHLTVVEDGDTEHVVLIGVASPVWPFRATGQDFHAPKTEADVTFERDANGRVTEVVVTVKGLVLRARRID